MQPNEVVQTLEQSCRICGALQGHTHFRFREMMFGSREEFDYLLCADCGCLQILEFPEDVTRYYPERYYSLNGRLASHLAYRFRDDFSLTGKGAIGRLLFDFFPNEALGHVARLQVPYSARILDVGCGSGSLIRCLGRNGYSRITGIDPYLERHRVSRGRETIEKLTIEEMSGEWDLIMFHHSLEHMRDPLSALTSALRLLSSGGRCLVRVPTVDSYAWWRYRANWVQLDAPRHFFLFSNAGIELLSKEAGMRVVEITYDSIPFQLWGSEQYEREIPLFSSESLMVNPLARTFSRSQKKAFKEQTRELNEGRRGDQIAVVLARAEGP